MTPERTQCMMHKAVAAIADGAWLGGMAGGAFALALLGEGTLAFVLS